MSLIQFGPHSLDPARCELRVDGERVDVQRKVFEFLLYLIEHRDRVVSKEELLDEVWDGTAVGGTSVSRTAALARRALADDAKSPQWISTVHGRGYRFVGSVEGLASSAGTPEVGGSVEPQRRPLIGRGREQEVLRAALGDARRGIGGMVLLEAEAGIGKSRLLEWCGEEARLQGVHAIASECRQEEGAPPLLPWSLALRELLRSPAARSIGKVLRRTAADLSPLFPEVFDPPQGSAPAPPPDDPRVLRFRAHEALVDLLREVSSGAPIAFLIDDLHWSDSSTIGLLELLVTRLARSAVLFVASARPPSTPPTAAGAGLLRLARDRRCTTLAIGGLEKEQVRSLLGATTGAACSDELAAYVWRQTGGNAFFVCQVAPFVRRVEEGSEPAALARALPQTVRKTVEYGFATLSADARLALEASSVIGRAFVAGVLADSLEWPRARAFDALDESVTAGLLEPIGDQRLRYRFVHALVRDILYEDLPARRRAELHGSVAQALESSSGSDAALSGDLARHFEASQSDVGASKAIDYHVRAAEEASRRFAYDASAAHYRRALELMDARSVVDEGERCSLLTGLAFQKRLSGSIIEAWSLWIEAGQLARTLDDPAPLLEIMLESTMPWGIVDPGQLGVLVELLEECADRHPQAGPERAHLLVRLAHVYELAGRFEDSDRISETALALATEACDPRLLAEALATRHLKLVGTSRVEERVRLGEEITALAQRGRHYSLLTTMRGLAGIDLVELGRLREADVSFVELGRLAEGYRNPDGMAALERYRAMRAMMEGRFDDAKKSNQRAAELVRECAPSLIWDVQVQAVVIAYEEGTLPEGLGDELALLPPRLLWTASRLRILQALGRRDQVEQGVHYVMQGDPPRPRSAPWTGPVAVLAECVAYIESREYALRLREWLRGFEDQHALLGGTVVYYGPIRRYVGLLELTLGERAQGIASLVAALASTRELGARLWEARIHMDLARAYAREGSAVERTKAREHASEAARLASEIGMRGLETEARSFLEDAA